MGSTSNPQEAQYLTFKQQYLTTFLCALNRFHSGANRSSRCGNGADDAASAEKAMTRESSPSPSQLMQKSATSNGDAVKYAANLSLALSAQGSPLWSRALLAQLQLHHRRQGGQGRGTSPSSAMATKRYRALLKARSRARNAARRSRHRHTGVLHLGTNATRGSSTRVSSMYSRIPSLCRVSCSLSKRSATGKRRLPSAKYAQVLRSLSRSRKASSDNKKSSSVAMVRQVMELGELVPGGHLMDTPLLLQQTAHYIHSLHSQIQALQSLLHSPSSNPSDF